MQFREIVDRERENIMMSIFTLFAIVLSRIFNYWGLDNCVGEEIAIIICWFIGLIIYIFAMFLWQLIFIKYKIKIKPATKLHYDHKKTPIFNGIVNYATLDVEIPNKYEITDCYITLDSVIPIYYEDRVVIDSNFSNWFSEISAPEYKRLVWKTPFSNKDCKITIGDNSNKESFYVAKINIGSVTVGGKTDNFSNFEFCLCSCKPKQFQMRRLGLYVITLSLDCMRHGRKMITKKFDGYVYSEIKGVQPHLIIGSGNYDEDRDIPKPLLKKA